jgi:hypothetical protein
VFRGDQAPLGDSSWLENAITKPYRRVLQIFSTSLTGFRSGFPDIHRRGAVDPSKAAIEI